MAKIFTYSRKKKSTVFLFWMCGFFLGLHAFYAKRFLRGFFLLISLSGTLIYFGFLFYSLLHSKIGHMLDYKTIFYFMYYLILGSIKNHLPLVSSFGYWGNVPFYLFFLGILVAFYDGVFIMFNQFKDGEKRKIVSASFKTPDK